MEEHRVPCLAGTGSLQPKIPSALVFRRKYHSVQPSVLIFICMLLLPEQQPFQKAKFLPKSGSIG